MPVPVADATRPLRISFYGILIALAVGDAAGRILAVNAVNRAELEQSTVARRIDALRKRLVAEGRAPEQIEAELAAARPQIELEERRQRPFLSGNDRSRWLAIRAVVELGQFSIDPLLDRHVWNTIDMVQHPGPDGQPALYSSKPPLTYLLPAMPYWAVVRTTGMTLGTHPYVVGRALLLLLNVVPLIVMLAALAAIAEELGQTDWGRLFMMACAAFGTLLTPFAVTLNNHLPAAVAASLTLLALVKIGLSGHAHRGWFALAGLAAALTAAHELPALALLAGVAAWLALRDFRQFLLGFAPPALAIVVAFFAANYVAHDSLRPPYMHRSATDPSDNWYAYRYTLAGQERDSYWLNPQGIDRGEPSKAAYALHCLVGHHGIFSLTPIWLLTVAGLLLAARDPRPLVRKLAAAVAALSLLCLVFYIGLRPQSDRNYGGMTSGLRWMFWFAPLWLATMLPAVDAIARRRSRWLMALALTLLAFSAMSASYPTWNPWVQPWIYRWLEQVGWQGF
jgi:hypothetical protein